MKKYIFSIFMIVLISYSFSTDQSNSNFFTCKEIKEDCRLSEIYQNSKLLNSLSYDDNGNLIKFETFWQRDYYFSTFKYDDLGRKTISNVYFTRAGQRVLKPDSSNFIMTNHMAKFSYLGDSDLIDEILYYRGSSIKENTEDNVKDENLEFREKAKFYYDKDILKEVILEGVNSRKPTKVKFTLDNNSNPVLIEFFVHEENGEKYQTIERTYDNSPILIDNGWAYFNFFESTNNVKFEKKTVLPAFKGSPKEEVTITEYPFEYHENGLISGYTDTNKNGSTVKYEYKYTCD